PELVGVLRVRRDLTEVPAAVRDAFVAGYLAPGRAAVLGAVEPALPLRRAVDQRIDTVRPGGRCRQPNPRRLRGQAVTGQVSPRLAPVGRLIEAAAGPVRRRVSVPRRPSRLPQRGIDDLR